MCVFEKNGSTHVLKTAAIKPEFLHFQGRSPKLLTSFMVVVEDVPIIDPHHNLDILGRGKR